MIRKAEERDLCRIAEILVFVKRINYRPIFQYDPYSFGELQVFPMADEYRNYLDHIWVWDDDGIVKALVRLEGDEIRELYVDHFFQCEGIGAKMLAFAVEQGCTWLWALEKKHWRYSLL